MEELKNTVRSTEETVHMGFLIRTIGDPTTLNETLHPIFQTSEYICRLCHRTHLRDVLARQVDGKSSPIRDYHI